MGRTEKKGTLPLCDTTAIPKSSDSTDAVSHLACTDLDSSLRSEDGCLPHPEGIAPTVSESRRERTAPGAAAALAPGNICHGSCQPPMGPRAGAMLGVGSQQIPTRAWSALPAARWSGLRQKPRGSEASVSRKTGSCPSPARNIIHTSPEVFSNGGYLLPWNCFPVFLLAIKLQPLVMSAIVWQLWARGRTQFSLCWHRFCCWNITGILPLTIIGKAVIQTDGRRMTQFLSWVFFFKCYKCTSAEKMSSFHPDFLCPVFLFPFYFLLFVSYSKWNANISISHSHIALLEKADEDEWRVQVAI